MQAKMKYAIKTVGRLYRTVLLPSIIFGLLTSVFPLKSYVLALFTLGVSSLCFSRTMFYTRLHTSRRHVIMKGVVLGTITVP